MTIERIYHQTAGVLFRNIKDGEVIEPVEKRWMVRWSHTPTGLSGQSEFATLDAKKEHVRVLLASWNRQQPGFWTYELLEEPMELPEGYKVIDQPKERSDDGGCMGETVKQWYCTVQTPAGQKLFATGQGRDDVEFKIKKLVAEHATYEAASTRAKLRILVEKGKANNGLLSRDLSAAVLLMAEIVLGGEP